MERFRAAVAFVGAPTADFVSHLKVSWDFLRAIWYTNLPHIRKAKTTGQILERLAEMLARNGQINSVFRTMVENSKHHTLLREYLISWLRGHFFGVV